MQVELKEVSKIYCIYCDEEKSSEHFLEGITEIFQILEKSRKWQKDTTPWFGCKKCLGYRRRSKRREAGKTYKK